MAGKLDGTTAVVTGASSGIGAATARALAAEGATVALFARRLDRLETLAKEINSAAGRAHAYQVDITDADAVRAAVDRVAADLGGIDILVNNAGYGMWARARDAVLAEWRKMVDVNVNGVLATSHAALPHLTAAALGPRGIADLVTVSSLGGRKVTAPPSNVYAATKHAVGAFCEGLRQELAEQHVRVGLVEPGVVVTEMTTNGRNNAPNASAATELGALQPADIADAIVYMVTRPRRTAVNEMLVRPTEQVV
ncbi:SDR family oxidoreductase [Pseudonocardia acaciae]|uniref:SDR family oxidoreductase n=1 Tax=Pseudonocardia acaciae TaxID=551276 RepID=UPI00048E18DD|nr:SDR family NAD(P)-dependent oxidoreductase [Pseudonocardia acaciae]